jgi:hypothetical protein
MIRQILVSLSCKVRQRRRNWRPMPSTGLNMKSQMYRNRSIRGIQLHGSRSTMTGSQRYIQPTQDPFTISQNVRKKFRTEKKAALKEEAESQAVSDRLGLGSGVKVLPESREDLIGAKRIDWDTQITQTVEESTLANATTIFGKKIKTRNPMLQKIAASRRGDPFSTFSFGAKSDDGVLESATSASFPEEAQKSATSAPGMEQAQKESVKVISGLVQYSSSDDDD